LCINEDFACNNVIKCTNVTDIRNGDIFKIRYTGVKLSSEVTGQCKYRIEKALKGRERERERER
jgi:hypothetical protein